MSWFLKGLRASHRGVGVGVGVGRSPSAFRIAARLHVSGYVSAVTWTKNHRQWPPPAGFRARKKRRSTRLSRPTPRALCGVWEADLVAPLVGNGEHGRRRRRGQFRGQTHVVCILRACTSEYTYYELVKVVLIVVCIRGV